MKDRYPDGTHRVPVDREAALCFAKQPAADELSIEARAGVNTTMEPREIRTPPETIKDWTGKRKDGIVVIGYHARKVQPNGTVNHLWVVRCDCGRFETRRHKRLSSRGPKYDVCKICHKEAGY
jgi:hypothetical protein